MSKKEKLDLKTPDVFHTTTDKIFLWIEAHVRTVIGTVAAVVVVSLVLIGVGVLKQRREYKAAEGIYQVEENLKKLEAKVQADQVGPKGTISGPRKDFAAEYGGATRELEAKLKEFSGTRVALVAALNLSYFLMQEKQFARAAEVLDLVTYRPGSADLLGAFFGMHRGLVALENQKYPEALSAYQSILNQKKLAAFHPEALLKLGLARDLAGEIEAARSAFERITREYPGTEASASAENMLRLLLLKAKKG